MNIPLIKNLATRFSPSNVGKMLPMMLSLGGYLPIVMNAANEMKEMSYHPDSDWDPAEPHPFNNPEEKCEILERAKWLCEEVIGAPQSLIDKMPKPIGREYQGQWAFYAISMTTVALSNIAYLYPECKENALYKIPKLIDMAMTPVIKLYDSMKWKEDPLESLSGKKSHMTYLSILAWMIGHYKITGGDGRYDSLYHNVCHTLYRRMMQSPDMNLPSFPNGIVFLPDMMFTPLALSIYSKIYNGKYTDTVRKWAELTKAKWIDRRTGLLISRYYKSGQRKPPCGAYAALNCSCLASFDEDFGLKQYVRTKSVFGRTDLSGKYAAIKEYLDKSPKLAFDVDAGIILNGMSPSGTAFILGAATYFGDWKFRRQLLNTADKAGGTKKSNGKRHYKLAEIMLTGEAITLAMRTNVKRQYPSPIHPHYLFP